MYGKVDDGGSATKRGGTGAGLEIVGACGASKRHIHMCMRIHASWDYELIGSIDLMTSLQIKVGTDQGDLVVFDVDVGTIVVGGGNDPAISNQERHQVDSTFNERRAPFWRRGRCAAIET